MTCQEFQDRLREAQAARDAAAVAALAVHGETCSDAGCRQEWADEQLLHTALAQWSAAAKGRQSPWSVEGLTEAVLLEVFTGRSSLESRDLSFGSGTRCIQALKRPAQTRRSAGGLAAAAAVLLVGLLLLIPSRTGDGVAIGPGRNAGPLLSSAELPATPGSGAEAVVRDLSGHYVGYAQQATHFVTDLALLVVPVAGEVDGEESSGAPDLLQRIGERIEPVRSGVSTKFGEWFGSPRT